jgi:hypothetical protein
MRGCLLEKRAPDLGELLEVTFCFVDQLFV